ncbi:hypothetical protein FF36_00824 [Frankia torreyi]|uniref:Septum formation initiator n=1 Tax=Frankia torreyi TaxID=1856 RepID=A0A0D8BN28_9ACTN|nr:MULTISPECIES: hypothetical protein [Frankia]KJE24817.1 hypothetical protein FF36_00824 [Frankia torreyi]KQM07013.1 hypothetical protein FF86_1005100 [Frankia sp. CpI1-P]
MTAPAQPLSRAGRGGAGRAGGPPPGARAARVPGAAAVRTAAATAPILDPPLRRAPARTRLTVVRPAPTGARKGPFVVLLLVMLGAGLLGLLGLNLALMENSFQENTLRNRASALADEEQSLAVRADQLSDPAALAAQASRFGMVPGGVPEYLAPGTPLPPGARVLSREPGSGSVLVIVPAPAGQQPPAGAGTARSGTGAAGSGTGTTAVAGTGAATAGAAGTAASTTGTAGAAIGAETTVPGAAGATAAGTSGAAAGAAVGSQQPASGTAPVPGTGGSGLGAGAQSGTATSTGTAGADRGGPAQ